MSELFSKTDFVDRIDSLLEREGIKKVDLIELTGYKKSTFKDHTSSTNPAEPRATDIIKLATALNTSHDHLLVGHGADYLTVDERNSYYKLLALLNDHEKMSYRIIIDVLLRLSEEHVDDLAELAISYAKRKKLL